MFYALAMTILVNVFFFFRIQVLQDDLEHEKWMLKLDMDKERLKNSLSKMEMENEHRAKISEAKWKTGIDATILALAIAILTKITNNKP